MSLLSYKDNIFIFVIPRGVVKKRILEPLMRQHDQSVINDEIS